MITLKQLSHALALEQHSNFHRAAKAENISQPALSRSIRALEAELEVVLFDRQNTTVIPTLFGQVLLNQARIMLSVNAELFREIQLLKGVEAGELSIAAGIYAATLSVSQAVGKIVNEYPNLFCRLRLTSWKQIPNLVLSRTVDIGVGERSESGDVDELEFEPVGNHSLLFFCRNQHPLARIKKPSIKDIDDFPLVTVRLPHRVAHVFPGKSHLDQGTGDLIPSIEVDDFATARSIVLESNAIGVAAPIQIASGLKSRVLYSLPIKPPWLKLNYGFIYLNNRTLSPATILFMEAVRAIERDLARNNQELMTQITE